jgi:hypothetical protein
MRKTLVAISLLAFLAPAWAQGPGYGTVESVIPLAQARLDAEESASAGGSRPPATKQARQKARGYLVRVRMDDGSIQVRTVKRAEVRAGQRALITNAGDVVPE